MSQKSPKHNKIIFGSSTTLRENDKHPQKITYGSSTDNNQSKQSNEISYLQPEILPLEVMKILLKMRGASEAILNKEYDARSFIIKLFYKHITPKPQREYKLNRLGKILMKMRCRRDKGKEKNEWESMVFAESSKISEGHCSISTSSKIPSTSLSSSCDRLKPIPSSCINLERKKIKLNRPSSSSPIKRNLVTEDVSHESESVKKITLDSHVSERKIKLKSTSPVIEPKSEAKLESSRKIKISSGRSSKETLTDNKEKIKTSTSPVKRESDSSVPEAKRKKAISWP